MSTFDTVMHVCKAVFEDELDLSAVQPSSRLREDIGINSIGMLYMAMALEEECGIKFNNDDFATIQTVQDVIDCIESKKG